MSSAFETNYAEIKEKLSYKTIVTSLCRMVVIIGLVFFLVSIFSTNHLNSPFPNGRGFSIQKGKVLQSNSFNPATNISHLLFGLLGSEKAWHHRKAYIEAWWRSGVTRGYLYLDIAPKDDLLPWSSASPPYRVSENLAQFLEETHAVAPIMIRMVHGIMEIFREDHEGFRWLVMGDDDSIFFVDNIVDVLANYDHTKHYYLGGQSEYIMSNFWFSFNQGFGGAGFILSYPLAKALANDMENCLRRYAYMGSADLITMSCISDIGINLSPQKGIHQIDLHGDLSGFLSSHPKVPLMSLHHFDFVEPIFPNMDRFESTRHLMKAANADQSRLLQQTVCHQRQQSWTISVSWGYSVHLYEKLMPRSWLQKPIETFQGWVPVKRDPPHYMFNTRLPSKDPCEAPHVFFFKSLERISSNLTLTSYIRSSARGLSACGLNGSYSADIISEIHVYSPAEKRIEIDRCECCDVGYDDGKNSTRVTFRECMVDEIVAW